MRLVSVYISPKREQRMLQDKYEEELQNEAKDENHSIGEGSLYG